MKLSRAIVIAGDKAVAFVGAGGKTSAMFALANELQSRVVLTTTTHLGAWQAGLAEAHQIVQTSEEIAQLNFNSQQVLLVTGPVREGDRLTGLKAAKLDALHALCQQNDIPLLIEADGARQCQLKAPADHEPVLPKWVDAVVVVAGLGGLGERLDADSVHRSEIFSKVAGLSLGERIQVNHLITVLASNQGGLKRVPEKAHRILILNQADSPVLQAKGGRIARRLVDAYDRILVGSLHQPGSNGPVFSVFARTAGVILAAGGSQRLGLPKQLLQWQGKPFIQQVAQNALAAGLAPLVVVTGADHARVEEAVMNLPVTCVQNPNWKSGQAGSMHTGLQALPASVDSVLFLLSDQPQISPILIRQLIEHFQENRAPITAPLAQGQRANPVLFGQETFEALMDVQGDQGGRAVFKKFPVDWLPWIDDRVMMDVDKVGEDEALKKVYFAR